MWSLAGRRILITGATKGIGLAVAKECAALGSSLFLVSRHEDDLKRTQEELEKLVVGKNQEVHTFQGDVSDGVSCEELAAEVSRTWPSLDGLVNNAGTNIRKPTIDASEEDLNFIFDTNVKSAFRLNKLFFPLLTQAAEDRRGHQADQTSCIVNVSSVAGSRFVRSGVIYGMSKAAMDRMTQYLSSEWGPLGIRVNGVLPWYTKTPLVKTVLEDKDRVDRITSVTPLRRIAEAEDVARVVAFLCMPASSHVSGACIPVDGGFLTYGVDLEYPRV